MTKTKTIYFITTNKGKFREVKAELNKINIDVKRIDDEYPEIQADTHEEVASFGLEWLRRRTKIRKTLMIDDSGLFIDALNGFPGIYSSYVFKTIGYNGILKIMGGEKNRSARFESCIAYAEPDKAPVFFKGVCKGEIANKSKGRGGFGYDPIFISTSYRKTFAEIPTEEKNKISHRGKSLEQLVSYLKKKQSNK
jgi:XTP/dITP diphosphohydrolase